MHSSTDSDAHQRRESNPPTAATPVDPTLSTFDANATSTPRHKPRETQLLDERKHKQSSAQEPSRQQIPTVQGLTAAVVENTEPHHTATPRQGLPLDLPPFIPAQTQRNRKPSGIETATVHSSSIPHKPSTVSPLPHTKQENRNPQPDNMEAGDTHLKDVSDPANPTAVEAVANEHGLRAARSPSPDTVPASRKRAPPKSVAARKKGTARKPAAKKQKLDGKAAVKQRKLSKSNTPATESSPARDDASSAEDDEYASDGSDPNAIFCICRKGDNHTWMIACDGGCEDWFHGKCVNVKQEDEVLIDKYICPNCEKEGKVTTWKPMCRREGCRKPARLIKVDVSKYCSEECAKKFWNKVANKASKEAALQDGGSGTKAKNRRKSNMTDNTGNAMELEEHDTQEIADPKGRAIGPSELKVLIGPDKKSDISTFRALGEGVLDPDGSGRRLPSAPGGYSRASSAQIGEDDDNPEKPYTLNEVEQAEQATISTRKNDLRALRGALKDREKFIAMVKDQHVAWADREGIKHKDVCGFDSRLSWSNGKFQQWKESPVGVAAFKTGVLVLPPSPNTVVPSEEQDSSTNKMDADTEAAADKSQNGEDPTKTNSKSTVAAVDDSVMIENGDEKKDAFCMRKRCEAHKTWQRVWTEDVRKEESENADKMRELDRQESELQERAMQRWRREVSGLLDKQGVFDDKSGTTDA
jgi:COMPASS component SPP1